MTRKIAIRAAPSCCRWRRSCHAALNWYTIETSRSGSAQGGGDDQYLAYGRLLERMGASVHRAAAYRRWNRCRHTDAAAREPAPRLHDAPRASDPRMGDNGGVLVVAAGPRTSTIRC
jgi:hypothetical protein